MTVLQELAESGHVLPNLLMEYRELSKLENTYLDALPGLVNPDTGRLHTSFNQTVATTGRLSSSDPNLQNIPIRRELGRDIRRVSSREKTGCSLRPITHKSSCDFWPTFHATLLLWRRSSPAATFTGKPQR